MAPQHTGDAPFVFAAILPVVLLLVMAQVSEGRPRCTVTGCARRPVRAQRRTPTGAGRGTAGLESTFFLLILAGRAFGPGFGYLLGFTSMFASALLTAGVGPWLPFQMLGAAWVGLAAGLLPKRVRGRAEVAMLGVLGVISAYAYGALMNMWFWPFISGDRAAAAAASTTSPEHRSTENLVRFGWFTLITSTGGWDTGRAISTLLALLLLGRPVLVVLRRASGMGRIAGEQPCQPRRRASPEPGSRVRSPRRV